MTLQKSSVALLYLRVLIACSAFDYKSAQQFLLSCFEATACKHSWCYNLQMTKNPFTSQLLNASELMRGLSPAMVRQVLPLLDQLTPIYTDLAQGRLEFTPEPEETKRLIRTFYGQPLVPSGLLAKAHISMS